jgi:hypothetical protein
MTPDVIPAIFQASPNSRVRTSMTFGAGLESGWSDTATNPSGAAGPFQILLPVHPEITFQEAENPNSATAFMLPAYRAAVAQVPDSLWKTNPEVAAEQVAITAEQPGGAFPSQGQPVSYGQEGVDVVNQRWAQTTQYLTGPWNPGKDINLTGDQSATTTAFIDGLPGWIKQLLLGPLAPVVGGGTGPGILSAFQKILNFLSNPQDALERIGLIMFGAVMILMGMYVMAQGTTGGRLARQVVEAPVGGAAQRVRARASGASAARREQIGLQKQAMSIGERRVKVQEQRQARLSANAQLKAPAVGKHAKGGGGKHEGRSES